MSAEAAGHVYIVRFNEYKMAAEHKEEVTRSLGKISSGWSWIHRNNSATAYPTDFGLVRLAAGTVEASMASTCVLHGMHITQRRIKVITRTAIDYQ